MCTNKVLVWNVCGLNSVARQDSLRTFVESSRADIVCIEETKITNMSQRIVLSALGSCFSDFVVVPAVGASGGFLVAWKNHVQTIGIHCLDSSSASVQFCSENGSAWWLTCVYGRKEMMRKLLFCRS
jgi:exonuclease III